MPEESWLVAALRESEERYRSLFENSVLGIYRTTPDGRILAANRTLVAMLGYDSFEELATRNLEELPAASKRAEFKDRIARDGEVRGLEAAWPRRDGSLLFVRENARGIRGPDGGLLYYEGTVEDISERKRIEEAERKQRLLAEALCETAAVLAGTLDFDELQDRILDEAGRVLAHDGGRILLLDGQEVYMARSRGWAERGLTEALGGLRLPLDRMANLRQIKETGRPLVVPDTRAFEGWVWLPNMTWIRSNVTAPIHCRGQIVGFLGLDSITPGFYSEEDAAHLQAFADQVGLAIDNARLYEESRRHASDLEARVAERTAELSKAMQQLQELDRLKSQFVSNVSHELRTPLANIKLYLSLLRNGKAEKHEQYMDTLEREAGLLQRLIEDLLQLSRLDLDKVQPELACIDINRLVAALAGDRAALLADHGLQLRQEVAADPLPVWADARRLTQVLTNLMTNAMNYTPRGGTITVGTGRRDDRERAWITFFVRDTGPGIPPAEQVHLFERFFRGEAARQSGTPGTGLGLSICHEIVARHGGRITVASVEGQGSAFTVWLPAADGNRAEEAGPFAFAEH